MMSKCEQHDEDDCLNHSVVNPRHLLVNSKNELCCLAPRFRTETCAKLTETFYSWTFAFKSLEKVTLSSIVKVRMYFRFVLKF